MGLDNTIGIAVREETPGALPQKVVGGGVIGDWRKRTDGLRPDGGRTSDGHGTGWSAVGSPFLRDQWRARVMSAEEKDPEKYPDPVQAIWDYVEDYKTSMIQAGMENEIMADNATKQSPAALPQQLVDKLRGAYHSKDSSAMVEALADLDEYDPKSKSYEERIEFFRKELTKVWSSPEVRRNQSEASEFILSSIKEELPFELQELANDAQKRKEREYEKQKQLALQIAGDRPNKDTRPFGNCTTQDAAMHVIRTRSTSAAWETTACMGIDPGVGFGCHCSAIWAHTSLAVCNGQDGEMSDPIAIQFDRFYTRQYDLDYESDQPKRDNEAYAFYLAQDLGAMMGEAPGEVEDDDPTSPFYRPKMAPIDAPADTNP